MCVLRASGTTFDPDEFERSPSMLFPRVYRKGEPRGSGSKRVNDRSGLTVDVSDASWADLPAQIADAERFLENLEADLRRLVAFPGVEGVCLDFPVDLKQRWVQSHVFPASLVRAAGALGIDLEQSLYVPAHPEPKADDRESGASAVMHADQLVAVIQQAFADVEYPGDWCLRGSNEGDEPFRVESEFKGKSDRYSLDPAFLDSSPAGLATALYFFSHEAFRFYLPAYLIADVGGQLRRTDPVHALTHGLTDRDRVTRINPRRYGARTTFESSSHRLSVFDVPQAAAIIEYLKFRRVSCEFQRNAIDQALANFWRGRVGVTRRSGDDARPEGEA